MRSPSRITYAAAAVAAAAAICTLWLLRPAPRPAPPAPGPTGPAAPPVLAAPPARGPAQAEPPRPRRSEPVLPSAQPRAAPARAPSEQRPQPAPPAPLDRVALRYQVRWGDPGLCGPEGAARLAARARLLSRFVPLKGAVAPILHDPAVPRQVLDEVERALFRGATQALNHGLLPYTAPTVYVYRDLEQMLSASCANTVAIGYYDGAIHLSGDPRHGLAYVTQTVVHEYAHHQLMSRGVELPTWLQEGLAMDMAGEDWWRDGSLGLVAWARDDHLPFQDLVSAFPAAADERFATAVYVQSVMMFQLVRGVRGPAVIPALVDGLARRELKPEKAFEWAIGLSGAELEEAWKVLAGTMGYQAP